jgi:preprotein translocase subunit SecA
MSALSARSWARRRTARPLARGAPYVEQLDREPSRIDRGLLHAWGYVAPRLLSQVERRRLEGVVARAESYEPQIRSLSDRQLREAADALREHLSAARFSADAVARAFTLAREAAGRHVGMRHFHVQLLGGAAMMKGALAEMETGEGKTLTALLPAVTAALAHQPVHVITVNDYLARRDADLLRPAYAALGLTVGVVEHGQDAGTRQAAYACDVTYCTNKEIVFDYLRDRLHLGARRARPRLLVDKLLREQERPQQPLLLRGLHFAVVDEADSVLIDEARTPLILSGREESPKHDAALYETALSIARQLALGENFHIRSSERTVQLTAVGEARVLELLGAQSGLWAIRRAREQLIEQALAALHLYRCDTQYIVADDKVQIVDEYTGRTMPDRAWEGGLHQMIEVKEGCALTERRGTLARITYQRFFRRYMHLCGMTGTALECSGELNAVYGLKVIRIPTNKPSQRRNSGTRVFTAAEAKWAAVVSRAGESTRAGRAMLIGTRSVAASEHLGALLREAGLAHVILNARQNREEAQIVAAAGQPGRITVATNMAGRGTDIQPAEGVLGAGGLHVILTEFHESPRIDRQLFGRGGRQGDPGSHECFIALGDELFRRFAPRWLLRLLERTAKLRGKPPVLWTKLLRNRSQAAAERQHARALRFTLTEDLRQQRALGFAGTGE